MEKPTAAWLANLPRSNFSGNAMYFPGGKQSPVDPRLKISVWVEHPGYGPSNGYWKGLDRADRHDWSKPTVYRLRESALRPEATEYKRARILAIVRQLQKYAEELEQLA